ncbi:threonine aldolase family protein [Dyadobacter sp. LJ53]|uniref:threonine aldolase family protein n=1 Tax=Dyadobacter chenwenxiniae TaxID=2906456 RepID=UPI001F2EB018|nr:beta-eliminating lyase-related protein [Dyadobacter chenwenxiniae]MCF0051669.1 threonine aldolase family protein [Dyadobacter chenwenxiniae]
MRRRDFVKLGSILAATATPRAAFAENGRSEGPWKSAKSVDFLYDGLNLSPMEYANLLMKLADEGKIKPDFYSNGGVVEELEVKFAKLLGKESGVFMPTGTLANHIAIRKLSGNNRRVIVQEQSHIYNDTGDCSQILSGLNLIPLGTNAIEFSLDDVEKVIAKTKLGRVEAQLGTIAIETPVRRQRDRMISYNSLKEMTEYARKNDIKTHLDGARLFKQSVHTGIEPRQYGELFDTVFTSMWKCFNASSGAILAGDRSFTDKLFHERRMFGGGLPAAWVFAAVALHYADGFIDDYKLAWSNSEKLFSELARDERVKFGKIENGTHFVNMQLSNANPEKFRAGLAKRNIEVAKYGDQGFMFKINPSINRVPVQELTGLFHEALTES